MKEEGPLTLARMIRRLHAIQDRYRPDAQAKILEAIRMLEEAATIGELPPQPLPLIPDPAGNVPPAMRIQPPRTSKDPRI